MADEAKDSAPATLEEPNKLLGNVRRLIADVGSFDDVYGEYTVKSDSRQTGASVHIKFANKVDVMETLKFVNFLASAPNLIYSVLRQLEAALIEREDVDG